MADYSLTYSLNSPQSQMNQGEAALQINGQSYAVNGQSRIPMRCTKALAIISGGSKEMVITLLQPEALEAIIINAIAFITSGLEDRHSICTILGKIAEFVSQRLSSSSSVTMQALEKKAIESGSYVKHPKGHQVPCVPLTDFIQHRTGVCRQHGMLTAILIQACSDRGILPPGKAFYHRQYLDAEKNRRHGWAIFVISQSNPQIYSVDSFRHQRHPEQAVSIILQFSQQLEKLYLTKAPISTYIYHQYKPRKLLTQFENARDASALVSPSAKVGESHRSPSPKVG